MGDRCAHVNSRFSPQEEADFEEERKPKAATRRAVEVLAVYRGLVGRVRNDCGWKPSGS